MKICPVCKKTFSDELNFCLEDGGLLVQNEEYKSEQTLSFSDEQTWQISHQKLITDQLPPGRQTAPYKNSRKLGFAILLSVVSLMILGLIGVYFSLRFISQNPSDPPSNNRQSPRPTPTPKEENNVKVEILEKVTNGFGTKYLKCKVTNIGDRTVELSSIGLNFYKGDVKVDDAAEFPKMKILKPNQTTTVWINTYGTDGYTSVKVKEPVTARPVTKTEAQLFPKLQFSQTEMKSELDYISINFRQYRKIYYKVSGIVENPNDEEISVDIYVIYYDESSEIVGIESTRVSDLEKGVKTKFEVAKVETDIFGKPKTFEIIAISNR